MTPMNDIRIHRRYIVVAITSLLGAFFIAKIPSAAAVPRMVEITAEQTATRSVTFIAWIISASRNSSWYQRREKPVHTERLFVLLNEKAMRRKIGAYIKRKMSTM